MSTRIIFTAPWKFLQPMKQETQRSRVARATLMCLSLLLVLATCNFIQGLPDSSIQFTTGQLIAVVTTTGVASIVLSYLGMSMRSVTSPE